VPQQRVQQARQQVPKNRRAIARGAATPSGGAMGFGEAVR